MININILLMSFYICLFFIYITKPQPELFIQTKIDESKKMNCYNIFKK